MAVFWLLVIFEMIVFILKEVDELHEQKQQIEAAETCRDIYFSGRKIYKYFFKPFARIQVSTTCRNMLTTK